MSAWLTLQYTLTETHVGGSGTAAGGIDLPFAREATTDLPFLPETALKGVVRDAAERSPPGGEQVLARLLGWVGKDLLNSTEEGSQVGALSLTQGHLLLYPLRSLQRPFVYATSALLLSRLVRLAAAFDLPLEHKGWSRLLVDSDKVRVADAALATGPLILEQLAYRPAEVEHASEAAALGKLLAGWFGADIRGPTGARVGSNLVVLPDAELVQLLRSAAPVRARVKLNERKTTTGDGGNLWYEEMLPSDCLFWSMLSLRSQKDKKALSDAATELLGRLQHTQIGAGESTGHGRCWWWIAGSKA
jgi:CRISPR-associated protein Cmr4